MASVRARPLADGSTTYAVRFRHDERQTSVTFPTRQAADVFAADLDRHGPDHALRILASRRNPTTRRARTVAEQLRHHIDALPGVTIGTRRRYEMIARTIAAHRLGTLPLDVVDRHDVSDWIRDLHAQGLAGKTISVRRQLLSAAFVRAVDDEHMTRNPAHSVKVPRSERLEQTYLTLAEFTRLMEHVAPRDRALIVTLVGTGLRIGEATALQARDIHLGDSHPTLTVSRGWVFTGTGQKITGAPKTERGRRTVTLPAQVVDAIAPLVAGRAPEDWVFTDPSGGPVSLVMLNKRWRAAVDAARLGKRPRIHDLRHTHASWILASGGVSLTTLQHRLGHASIKVTSDVYGHLMPEAQVQAARAAELSMTPRALEITA